MPRPRPALRTFAARRAERDERGAVMILAAVGLLLALVSSALAVDIGRQASEKKSDQLIADLAALDAARELEPIVISTPLVSLPVVIANAQDAAEDSARRNGFDPDAAGNDLTADVGTVDAQNVFTSGGSTPNAVKVTVTSVVDYIFDSGGRSLTATAVAKLGAASGSPSSGGGGGSGGGGSGSQFAGFNLGSALASADSDAVSAPVLDAIMGRWIGGNADVLSWKGLGDATVTMQALQQQLVALGTQAGTPQELLAADLTLNRLFTATANALDQQGTSEATAAAQLFRGSAGIVAQSTNTTTFKLADIMSFNQGAGDTVADATLEVRKLVVASAQAANGDNVVVIPDAGVTVPGTSNLAVSVKVVEPMKYIYGPVGWNDSTSQIELTVTPTLDRAIPVPLLSNPKVTGTLPITFTSAGAKGTIANIDCSSAPSLTVGVDTQPVTSAATATLRVTASLPLVGTVPVLDVPTTGTMPQIAADHTDLSFAYDTEFSPVNKRAGTFPLDIDTANAFSASGTPTVLNTVSVSTQTIVDAVMATLPGVMTPIERIINHTVKSLGLTVGVAEVEATDHMCVAGNPPTSTSWTSSSPAPPVTIYRPILVG